MNWKVAIMLCLLIFATATITNVLSTAVLPKSLSITKSMGSDVALDTGSLIEPLGDPVDNKEAPK